MTIPASSYSKTFRLLSKVVRTGAGALLVAGLAMACSSNTSSMQAASPPAATASAAASTPVTAPSAAATATTGSSATIGTQSEWPTGIGPRAVLAPATVPPVSDECTRVLIHDADGNVQPVACAGGVNVNAWKYYASAGDSSLLALGRGATQAAIYQAMCHDYTDVYKTKAITGTVEEIAQDYYGWTVNASALQHELVNQGCPAS